MPVLHSLNWLLFSLSFCLWSNSKLSAQPTANSPATASSTAPLPANNVSPVVFIAKSPVDLFRELLLLDAPEREERLVQRSPADRKAIMAKLEEYNSLTPEERELRLRTTQLHWYMLKFMTTPATNRAAVLESVPKADRPLVEERMKQWIILPPELQAEILEYESTSSYFGLRGNADTNTQKVLQNLPPDKRREVEEKLAHWNALSPEEQRRMAGQFEHFFGLTPREKEKTLGTLSEPEREQMKNTLLSFQQLPKATRELCLQAFGRFARMTAYEQQQFLRNAERWREMSPSERDAWQRLVRYLAQAPPMPPGMDPIPSSTKLDPRYSVPPGPGNVPVATNPH